MLMLLLPAKVCGCISAHQGFHINERNGKKVMHEKVSYIKPVDEGSFEVCLRKSMGRPHLSFKHFA